MDSWIACDGRIIHSLNPYNNRRTTMKITVTQKPKFIPFDLTLHMESEYDVDMLLRNIYVADSTRDLRAVLIASLKE
jgi:hypothetical protein